jgi:hypothetical protein
VKRNVANLKGWCLLEFTPQEIKDGSAVHMVELAVRRCRRNSNDS